MKLRNFQSADLKALHEIDQACFPPGISYSPAMLKRFIANGKSKTWVAEDSDEIAGFLIASEEPQKVGHIITIDVAQPHRRAGVGTMLMNAAEKWAEQKRLRLIYLETDEDNRPAQNFYAARGYHKVEE
ncbi:MAG TPA: GNAT family N-acetyltransferase, partial [Terriglobia bacterium]|nr:GNAT family N-acetyltransferase [Terriglobia bacterium]